MIAQGFESRLLGSEFLFLTPVLNWPLHSATNLAYHFRGPVTMCWSHLPSGVFLGTPPIAPRCSFNTGGILCLNLVYALKKKKKSAFHFNDDTTQRWGSCYRTGGIWTEVIGVVKSSSGGIPSFLHKLPMWELCVISHYRREWLCLTPIGKANWSHFSFSKERELGCIDVEFLLLLL